MTPFKTSGIFGTLVVLILFVSSCHSYRMASNSYIVRGDNNFVNRAEKIAVFLGPVLPKETWEMTQTPLNLDRPSKADLNQLNRLGYSKNTHVVLFSTSNRTPYSLLAAINIPTKEHPKVNNTLSQIMNRLTWKKIDNASWYYELKQENGSLLYHALIPTSNNPSQEKYLTLIYSVPPGEEIATIEHLVKLNAQSFQNLGYYLSDIQLLDCSGDTEEKYYNYYVPPQLEFRNQSLVKKEISNHYIIKAFHKENPDQLIFYRLLESPPMTQGAFKVCTGEYTLQYTTYSGEVLWSEDFVIQ